MIHYFSLVRIINSSEVCFYTFALFRHIRKYMSENESRKKTFISSYSYIYILYICTHINDFKLKEKQYG
jgi:hypothetical protein